MGSQKYPVHFTSRLGLACLLELFMEQTLCVPSVSRLDKQAREPASNTSNPTLLLFLSIFFGFLTVNSHVSYYLLTFNSSFFHTPINTNFFFSHACNDLYHNLTFLQEQFLPPSTATA